MDNRNYDYRTGHVLRGRPCMELPQLGSEDEAGPNWVDYANRHECQERGRGILQ